MDEITDFEVSTNVEEPKAPPIAPPVEPTTPTLEDMGDALKTATEDVQPPPDDRDGKGRFRHRAKSQQARSEDVPRIQELTRKLREAEAERDSLKAATVTPASVAKPAAPVREPVTFTDAEPKLEDFNAEPDPYTAWTRALARYDRRKEQFEADDARMKTERESAEHTARESWNTQLKAHEDRVTAFTKSHPEFIAKIQAVTTPVTPLLYAAIIRHEDGPKLMLGLADHPDWQDEFFLLTEQKPVTDHFVAITQRRLLARVQAVTTGSAAPGTSVTPAPRPPNPVRTGPISTGDTPPGDDDSLEAHEAFYGKRRRR